jgi:hypothetical protein
MPPEANHGLTFAEEAVLCIYRDGELIAIEKQNGKLERWATEPATRSKSLQIFGADKAQIN